MDLKSLRNVIATARALALAPRVPTAATELLLGSPVSANRPAARRIDLVRWLRTALVCAAVAYLATVVYVSFRRCVYPYELEWMEGAMVDHVERVLAGKPLYVEPSLDFVPFIYAPLFFWVSAAVAKVVGLSFLPLRIVSIASMLGSFGLIHGIVAKETDDRAVGVIAAGAFAASYMRSAQFLDIARVDSLSLVLSLGAIYVMRNLRERRIYWVLGAALLSLSFLAKQSSFLLALALMFHEVWVGRRRAAPFVMATLVGTLGVAAVIDWLHSGWFRYYTWELPRSHAIVKPYLVGFWTDDLAPVYAIAAAFGAFFFIVAKPRRAGAHLFHFLVAGSLVACAYVGRLHSGGWPNVLIPAFAALAILFGLGLAGASTGAERPSAQMHVFVLAVALMQLAILAFDPRATLPQAADAAMGDQLIRRLRAVKGDVFIVNHSWYARMAGKPTHAHRMAIDDVLRGDPRGEGAALAAAVRRALAQKKWSAVVLDDDFFERDALRTYVPVSPPFGRDGFYPATGIRVRPQKVLLPKP